MALIKCEGVSLGYENNVAVSGVDLTVERGDYLFIIGENGSGKSTLVKGLLGLLRPLGGKITYGDGLGRRGIGYLPQQTMIQRDFPASVREVVLSGCVSGGFHPIYTRADKLRAHDAMMRLHIHDIEKKSYRELSGGQQQRVLLARALCATRTLLLLDEPATGLDPEAMAELYETVGELHRRDGVTIIMVSHDLHALSSEAEHILRMKTTPVFYGTREDYLMKYGDDGGTKDCGDL